MKMAREAAPSRRSRASRPFSMRSMAGARFWMVLFMIRVFPFVAARGALSLSRQRRYPPAGPVRRARRRLAASGGGNAFVLSRGAAASVGLVFEPHLAQCGNRHGVAQGADIDGEAVGDGAGEEALAVRDIGITQDVL